MASRQPRFRSRRAFIATAVASVLAIALVAPGVAARHGHGPSRIDLPNGWAPEGITAGRGSTVYVGSLNGGGIYKADVKSGKGSVLVEPSGAVGVGTEYEADANRLWVAGGPTQQVRVYNASSGALLETYEIAHAGFLNDLVVTKHAVYVTDSQADHLEVIPFGPNDTLADPADVTQLQLGGDFEQVAGFNLNGIVASHGWLITVQSNTGLLFRVNPKTGEATTIAMRAGVDVRNGDGLEIRGGILFVVQNQLNRVEVFLLGPRLSRAFLLTTFTSDDLDIPTTAALVGGKLYAVNARFGTPVTPDTEYWITRLPR